MGFPIISGLSLLFFHTKKFEYLKISEKIYESLPISTPFHFCQNVCSCHVYITFYFWQSHWFYAYAYAPTHPNAEHFFSRSEKLKSFPTFWVPCPPILYGFMCAVMYVRNCWKLPLSLFLFIFFISPLANVELLCCILPKPILNAIASPIKDSRRM